MIKRILPALIFSFFFVLSKGQSYNPNISCVDSSAVNIYYPCNDPNYNPVCGCNGVTYRNACAAVHWGGLVNNTYRAGSCGDFSIDLVPNIIVPASQLNTTAHLGIYTTVGPVTALIQLYDVYGRIWYEQSQVLDASIAGSGVIPIELNINYVDVGIYYLFVSINGEAQHIKVMKASSF